MKMRIPKLDDDGIPILCQLCYGEGCYDCNYEGVEMEENDEYVNKQIDDFVDERGY